MKWLKKLFGIKVPEPLVIVPADYTRTLEEVYGDIARSYLAYCKLQSAKGNKLIPDPLFNIPYIEVNDGFVLNCFYYYARQNYGTLDSFHRLHIHSNIVRDYNNKLLAVLIKGVKGLDIGKVLYDITSEYEDTMKSYLNRTDKFSSVYAR